MKKSFNSAIYSQESFTDYPKAASSNAKRALTIRDEKDSKVSGCGTPVGWARANQLAKREPISRDTIARMASFNRHRQNSDGDPRENCGPLMWLAWGGTAGIDWAIKKMEELRQEAQNLAQVEFIGEVDDIGYSLGFFQEALIENDGEQLEVLIHSPGGAVFEGINIASMLQRRKGETITTATGLAASIATVILMAGDQVQMDKDAFLMIHDAWAVEMGDSKELRKTARLLDKISAQIATIYTNQIEKAGKLIDGDRSKTEEKVRQLMRAETWLNANEALEMGLIDKVVSAKQTETELIPPGFAKSDNIQAKFRACLTKYKNTPNNILSKYENKPEMEKDKKSLWQSIKAFFAPEIKAEIEAAQEPAKEEEPTTIENENNEEMTIEEMKAALEKEGYNIEAKAEEVKEEEKQEEEKPTVDTSLMARLEKIEAENAKMKEELKAAKFEASAKPGAGESEGEKADERTIKLNAKQKNAFAMLAQAIKQD